MKTIVCVWSVYILRCGMKSPGLNCRRQSMWLANLFVILNTYLLRLTYRTDLYQTCVADMGLDFYNLRLVN